MQNSDILKHCCIQNNNSKFVGLKISPDGYPVVYFPFGYHYPDEQEDIIKDIHQLLSILTKFSNKTTEPMVALKNNGNTTFFVDSLISAYIEIIRNFLMYKNYYIEKKDIHAVKSDGKINWQKTFNKQIPILQSDKGIMYNKYIINEKNNINNELITKIHKYCVFESFSKLGWLYASNISVQPFPIERIGSNVRDLISVIDNKSNLNYSDKNRKLFSAMKTILQYTDSISANKEFYFGTDQFEYIWQTMIDATFSNVYSKQNYQPKITYNLHSNKSESSLYPDTIMEVNEAVYIIDAKYYDYEKAKPGSDDITKQIAYYQHVIQRFPDKKVCNLFLLPYNKMSEVLGDGNIYKNDGYIEPHWEKESRIYVILADTRTMMYNSKKHIAQLVKICNPE